MEENEDLEAAGEGPTVVEEAHEASEEAEVSVSDLIIPEAEVMIKNSNLKRESSKPTDVFYFYQGVYNSSAYFLFKDIKTPPLLFNVIHLLL